MNPNLDHTQLIPFANTGRHIGIIDFSQWYSSILDTAAVLATGAISGGSAPGWTTEDMTSFREWNVEFLGWLVNSSFGQQEHTQKNNHRSFAAMLVGAITLSFGDHEQVEKEAE